MKFIMRIILISLFWPVWFGAERLWFIYYTSTLKPVGPLPVDLSKIKDIPSGGYRGYLEITGYPGVQVAVKAGATMKIAINPNVQKSQEQLKIYGCLTF